MKIAMIRLFFTIFCSAGMVRFVLAEVYSPCCGSEATPSGDNQYCCEKCSFVFDLFEVSHDAHFFSVNIKYCAVCHHILFQINNHRYFCEYCRCPYIEDNPIKHDIRFWHKPYITELEDCSKPIQFIASHALSMGVSDAGSMAKRLHLYKRQRNFSVKRARGIKNITNRLTKISCSVEEAIAQPRNQSRELGKVLHPAIEGIATRWCTADEIGLSSILFGFSGVPGFSGGTRLSDLFRPITAQMLNYRLYSIRNIDNQALDVIDHGLLFRVRGADTGEEDDIDIVDLDNTLNAGRVIALLFGGNENSVVGSGVLFMEGPSCILLMGDRASYFPKEQLAQTIDLLFNRISGYMGCNFVRVFFKKSSSESVPPAG